MKIFRDQGHLKGEITAMHRLAQVDQAFCPIKNFQKNGKFRTISFVRKILALFFLFLVYQTVVFLCVLNEIDHPCP